MNPRFDSVRPFLFYGCILLVILTLVVGQLIVTAETTDSHPGTPIAFIAGSLGLFINIITLVVSVMIATAIFSLLAGCIQKRKNQFIALGILLGIVVFKDILPSGLAGTISGGIGGYLTSLLYVIEMCRFPLVIVLAGMLWFWPENKIIWKDAAFCSAFVVIAGGLILAGIRIVPGVFDFMNTILPPVTGNPEITALIHFSGSIIMVMLTLVLSWLGFRVIAEYRKRYGDNIISSEEKISS
jgi:hypothetical protein